MPKPGRHHSVIDPVTVGGPAQVGVNGHGSGARLAQGSVKIWHGHADTPRAPARPVPGELSVYLTFPGRLCTLASS